MSLDYESLKQQMIQFIKHGDESEEQFNQMALTLFSYQYEHNQAFRKFCRKRRVSPTSITSYREIPPVPIGAFKQSILSCCPPEEAQAVFMTSGTTNPELRGENYHRDLEVYDLSMKEHFSRYILPGVDRIRMAVLFPTTNDMPNSSLAHYLQLALEEFGTEDSGYMFSEQGFDQQKLVSFLREAEQANQPVLVIGATFSFVHFLDHCTEEGLHFQLPAGSRIMDTGGPKGRSREVDPEEFRTELSQLFSVPRCMVANMYGMSELSSQFYDAALRDYFEGQQEPRYMKVAPHWVRTLIIDPETMEEKPTGQKGIIIHYDLANINSVLSIMTEDMGIAEPDGFYLLGRATGAEAKGCSMAVEQFLAAGAAKP